MVVGDAASTLHLWLQWPLTAPTPYAGRATGYRGDRHPLQSRQPHPGLERGPVEFVDLAAEVVEVGQLLRQQPIILLCVCAGMQRCHRLPVAKAIAARYGMTFKHL